LVLPATDEESYDDQEPEPNLIDSYEVIIENEIDENEVEEDLDLEGENNLVEEIPTTSRSVPGLQREIRSLATYYNPDPELQSETAEIAMLSRVFNPTNTSLIASIHDGNPEPKTYFEAKASKEWQKWWEEM
jgi:hypothetical protein